MMRHTLPFLTYNLRLLLLVAITVIATNGSVRAQAGPPLNSNPTAAEMMGSCDFNGGLTDVNAFNAIEAIQAASLSYTRIGIFPERYLQGGQVKPEVIDSLVLALYEEDIYPMLLIEHIFADHGALGNEQKWFDIGAAFANRFRPNSDFLLSKGITDWGITQYTAVNEPDNNFDAVEFVAAIRGFADGVHSADPSLQVAPGGFQEVPLFERFNIYMDGLAPLYNDGTLNALDIHRYYDRRNPFNLQFKAKSHQVLIDSLRSWHNITSDFRVWCTEYNARGAGSDAENAKDFVTGTWDLLTVKNPAGEFVSDYALTFRTYLPVNSNTQLGMAVSAFPFLGNAKGIAHQMLANITQGLTLVSGDEATGIDILEGDNKKMWVWHNREEWSTLFGTSFTVNNIPSYANALEVYRYDSWNEELGSTGTPDPYQTITLSGATSETVSGLEPGETYMFVAKANSSFNDMPSVSITIPDGATTYSEGDTISITASASDPDGIREVVLYAGPIRLGSITSAPYTLDWTDIPAGTTTLLAIAKDNKGAVRLATQQVSVAHPDNGINLIAAADVYVKGGQTDDDNFGNSPSLLIKTAAGENLQRRIFLQFNVSELEPVERATLRLRVARTGNSEHTVYAVEDDTWQENSITWNNQPEYTAALANESVANEGRWTDFDLTEYVQQEQAGDGVLSLAIWTSSTALVEYFSKEAAEGNEPRLLVEAGTTDIGSPNVQFRFPREGFQYPSIRWPIVAVAQAATTDGLAIDRVDFYIDDSLVRTDNRRPYILRTRRNTGGAFVLKAVAVDEAGKESSATLNLSVSYGGTSLAVVDDTYVRGGNNADRNFGDSDQLEAKSTGAAFTRRSFLKFDLSSNRRWIKTATLRLKVKDQGTDLYSAAFVEDDSWEEETLTWNTEPTIGSIIETLPSAREGEYMIYNVTDIVKQEFNGDKTVSFAIISDGTSNQRFYSKESPDANDAPFLLINGTEDRPLRYGTRVASVAKGGVKAPPLVRESESTETHIYPNPVNETTVITFYQETDSPVNIRVHDTQGRVLGHYQTVGQQAGNHQVVWSDIVQGKSLQQGIYFVTIIQLQRTQMLKVLVSSPE
ncbi:CBM96 family carbohydrate-binding protein [Tunicatimonas pelagia]|uniref:CBM96 family carbohydrate-binding protein n=1 Tax=Tunicatimonas pelagia TaxID=931531 RepID=UPI00266546C9|nr:DNRLRE domain-containing protein [Tunicatimonas pelagia]WKN45699.1 DNRLRE domain-containing protein [Tunicatimonas pelagia]